MALAAARDFGRRRGCEMNRCPDPELATAGLSRISAYAGQPAAAGTWEEATAYARRINEADAYPRRDGPFWQAFARRMFEEGADGRPTLDYDPHIADVLKASDGALPIPDLWPLFRGLAQNRPLLLIRGSPFRSDRCADRGADARRGAERHGLRRSSKRWACAHAGRAGGQGRPRRLSSMRRRDSVDRLTGYAALSAADLARAASMAACNLGSSIGLAT